MDSPHILTLEICVADFVLEGDRFAALQNHAEIVMVATKNHCMECELLRMCKNMLHRLEYTSEIPQNMPIYASYAFCMNICTLIMTHREPSLQ